ncbi:MAG: formate dehydrogenase accessory sulfurtransferase FdhD [Chthoniobacterales bacterium]
MGAGTILRRKPDGSFECTTDEVAIEEPLEIRIGDKPLAITMRTPGNDPELAAGFLLSEGLIRSRADLCDMDQTAANVVEVTITGEVDLSAMTRFGTISSSCGLCGKASIDAVRQQFPPIASASKVTVEQLLSMPPRLRSAQGNFHRTGGLHAAALFELTTDRVTLREDVGRHNAVDKVIGRALLDDQLPLSDHALMVSGRASLEIIQKAVAAGVPIVASVSAPSSLAVNFARETGLTLIGFLRPPTFNVYSHVERIAT